MRPSQDTVHAIDIAAPAADVACWSTAIMEDPQSQEEDTVDANDVATPTTAGAVTAIVEESPAHR